MPRPVCLSLLLLLAVPALCQTAPAPAAPPSRPSWGEPRPGAMPFVHDPSTIILSDGRYYVFTTGRGIPILSSPDGANWARQGSVFTQIPDSVHAAVPKNNGLDVWAPDIIRLNHQFYLYYSVSSWGSFVSAVALATNPTLDPKDPSYKWTDHGVIVRSDGVEDLNAIDPGVLHAPDGTLWICYGSYHGTIRLLQLDPRTGLRIAPKSPVTVVATESEASDIIFHDGYYYLFVNHGSCCQGKASTYNIRVGRSRKATGPYVDRHGEPLTKGAGSLFLAAHDQRIGPGHFGRIIEDGAERFSLHYEADLTNGGRPTLGFRPLLWSVDGWPVAGDNLAAGTYEIVSRRTENSLEVALPQATPGTAPASGVVADAGVPRLRLARYIALDNQKWAFAPAAGGRYKILNLASGNALESSAGGPVEVVVPNSSDNQLWRLEELPDGGYRIRNQATGLTLAAAAKGDDGVAATMFAFDDYHEWTITSP